MKCRFPITPHVRRLVGRPVCHNFLKEILSELLFYFKYHHQPDYLPNGGLLDIVAAPGHHVDPEGGGGPGAVLLTTPANMPRLTCVLIFYDKLARIGERKDVQTDGEGDSKLTFVSNILSVKERTHKIHAQRAIC